MRTLLLFTLVLLNISCKNNKEIKPPKSLEQKEQIIEKFKGDAINSEEGTNSKNKANHPQKDKSMLRLPLKGGEVLITQIMEETIVLKPLTFTVPVKMLKTLCNSNDITHFSLVKKDEILPVIIEDECGDNTNYVLITYKDNIAVDCLMIYSYWTNMDDENPKEKITDFEITANYDIIISKKEYENKKLKEAIKITYTINEKGEIVKLK